MASLQTWPHANARANLDALLPRALSHSRVCITVQDKALDYLFIANLPDCWSIGSELPTDAAMFGDALSRELADLKADVLASREAGSIENFVGDRVFEFRVEAVPTAEPGPASVEIFTTIIELSEERRRERILRSLLREVTHRSKNLLAIIQSIAVRTARPSLSLDAFLLMFRGRVQSLAESQDLVTDSDWRGAFLRELLRRQAAKYVDEPDKSVLMEGMDVELSPNAALHIGLALHELIVNSVAYGAIRRGKPVMVRCDRTHTPNGGMIELVWREPLDDPPKNGARNFGNVVLERVAPSAVDGEAEYRITEAEVFYRLSFPLEAAET